MIEYRCPTDGALMCKADSPILAHVEWKCRTCKRIVEPVPTFPGQARPAGEVLHRTYRCGECGRAQHVERPVNDRTFCIVCGTRTLTITREVGARREAATADR